MCVTTISTNDLLASIVRRMSDICSVTFFTEVDNTYTHYYYDLTFVCYDGMHDDTTIESMVLWNKNNCLHEESIVMTGMKIENVTRFNESDS